MGVFFFEKIFSKKFGPYSKIFDVRTFKRINRELYLLREEVLFKKTDSCKQFGLVTKVFND